MDDDVPDTRVFVSGLPPNFTSHQLGAHFAGRYQITDAVVVPGRRIGFVGFRNYTLAKNAVKYFDKSYIRMSKISVEPAKPVEIDRDGPQAAPRSKWSTKSVYENHRSTPRASEGSAPGGPFSTQAYKPSRQNYTSLTASDESHKRKRDSQDGISQEHTDVVQYDAPPRSRDNNEPTLFAARRAPAEAIDRNNLRCKNESAKQEGKSTLKSKDRAGNFTSPRHEQKKKKRSTPLPEDPAEMPLLSVDHESDDNSQRRKRRREKDNPGDSDGQLAEVPRSDNLGLSNSSKSRKKSKKRESGDVKGGVESPNDNDAINTSKSGVDHEQRIDTKSDAAWLHGKTSRTLGLRDDDEKQHAISESLHDHSVAGSVTNNNDSIDRTVDNAACVTPPTFVKDRTYVTNGRLFVRNLPYSVEQVDVESLFGRYGKMDEVHIVRDMTSTRSKGIAFVQFVDPQAASHALRETDGRPFQGRLLHVLPASDKNAHGLDDFDTSKLPHKKQKALKRKAGAGMPAFSWSSMYMNPDAVISSVADRLGLPKSEVLDPTSTDAAVKQAHAETHIIQEAKSYLSAQGINLDSFKQRARDDRTLLVKNFTYGTTVEDLRQLFEPYGHISRLLMPPGGTIAVIQYTQNGESDQALRHLAYRNLKGSVLFLERAPNGIFNSNPSATGFQGKQSTKIEGNKTKHQAGDITSDLGTTTLFLHNLSFSTSSAQLTETFKALTGFLSARVKTKVDIKRPGEVLSMGFGFMEFETEAQAQAAIAVMNGYKLDGHELIVQASRKSTDTAEERRRSDSVRKLGARKTKIIIKNLPFEATKKDIRGLFGPYGQLRSVRVPKKFDRSTRGFAFADFISAKEAENALEALKKTHLLGRRLVLEVAEGDAIDPEEEIRAIEKRVGQQTQKIQLSHITGSGRTKFDVDVREASE